MSPAGLNPGPERGNRMLPNIERNRAGKQDHPREAAFLLNFPQKLAIVLNYGKERKHDNIEMRLRLFHACSRKDRVGRWGYRL